MVLRAYVVYGADRLRIHIWCLCVYDGAFAIAWLCVVLLIVVVMVAAAVVVVVVVIVCLGWVGCRQVYINGPRLGRTLSVLVYCQRSGGDNKQKLSSNCNKCMNSVVALCTRVSALDVEMYCCVFVMSLRSLSQQAHGRIGVREQPVARGLNTSSRCGCVACRLCPCFVVRIR